jgi:hypothetical protein
MARGRVCRQLDEAAVLDRLSQNAPSRFLHGTKSASQASLPLGSDSPKLSQAACTQHEGTDTGQTNRRADLAGVDGKGSAAQRSFLASSDAGSRQHPPRRRLFC